MGTDAEEICRQSNVRCDAVVINQCDKEEEAELTSVCVSGKTTRIKSIKTKERGLSRSRNMAIKKATAEFCLFADDDEMFEDDVEEIITDTYDKHPDADIIIFNVANTMSKPFVKEERVGFRRIMNIGTVRISVRRAKITENALTFDVEMGSGTGHGGGEEPRFLLDCKRKGLRIIGVPRTVAALKKGAPSQWFHGYTRTYFLRLGWTSRRLLGLPLSILYAFYTVVHMRSKYKGSVPMRDILFCLLRGTCDKNIFDSALYKRLKAQDEP